MRSSWKTASIFLAALTAVMTACDRPIPTGPALESGLGEGGASRGRPGDLPGLHRSATALDQELRQRLLEAAGEDGLGVFQLPPSTALGRIPQDPRNPLTPAKVELGRLLFHESVLAVDHFRPEGRESYGCASCHFAQAGFQANRVQGVGEGGDGFGLRGEGRNVLPQYDSEPHAPDLQPIRTPTILNAAFQELMLWNGQFGGVGPNLGTEDRWVGAVLESNHLGLHGLEAQAYGGMKVHRMASVELSRIAEIDEYRHLYRRAFPGDREPIRRLNTALAIAAWERTVLANEAPFQRWLRGALDALTENEKEGAVLFFGKAGCVSCHTGPALSSMTFHALGMHDIDGAHDQANLDLRPFGGQVSEEVRRGRGGFTGRAEDDFTFKTPQLYNLLDSPFYGHGASFASVRQVVEYKNHGVPENPRVPSERLAREFQPLGLTAAEVDAITAFLEGGLRDPDLLRYVPDRLPSGACIPVNDETARQELGCDP